MLVFQICKVISQFFGFINIYRNPLFNSKEWWINVLCKFVVLLVLIGAFFLQISTLTKAFDSRAMIVTMKILAESGIYWANLYVSFAIVAYHNRKIDQLIMTYTYDYANKNIANKLLWSEIVWIIVFTVTQLSYYVTTNTDSFNEYDFFVVMGYFLNKFYVNFMNTMLCFALRWVAQQFEEINAALVIEKMALTDSIKTTYAVKLNFKKIYRKWHVLSKSIEVLNEIVSPHVWLFLAINVIEFIFSLNQLVTLRPHCGNDKECIMNDVLISLAWFLSYFLPQVHFIDSCNILNQQISKTPRRVIEVEMECLRNELQRDLKLFAQELYEYDLTVTAGGCYKINNHLLISNAQTVLTYVMIQLQFESIGVKTFYSGFM